MTTRLVSGIGDEAAAAAVLQIGYNGRAARLLVRELVAAATGPRGRGVAGLAVAGLLLSVLQTVTVGLVGPGLALPMLLSSAFWVGRRGRGTAPLAAGCGLALMRDALMGLPLGCSVPAVGAAVALMRWTDRRCGGWSWAASAAIGGILAAVLNGAVLVGLVCVAQCRVTGLGILRQCCASGVGCVVLMVCFQLGSLLVSVVSRCAFKRREVNHEHARG